MNAPAILFCCAALLFAPPSDGQTRSAAAGLEKEFRAILESSDKPAWIGYTVQAVPGRHDSCCCGGEPARQSGSVLVLFRAEQRRVDKIRIVNPDCELDTAGSPFYRLTDVRPAESVALLASFAETERAGDAAVAAIAQHAAPEADRALEQFASPSRPERLRERAAFWLGAARGRAGYEALLGMLKNDPSERVRQQVVFALSVSKEPQAVDTLLETARTDRSAELRGRALFWLAQKAGKKAAGAIAGSIENDPDTKVKEQAVFALSQLPPAEGVPLLINVAKTNRNPAVRKRAMFWLGQSKDPRALGFFEEVLKN